MEIDAGPVYTGSGDARPSRRPSLAAITRQLGFVCITLLAAACSPTPTPDTLVQEEATAQAQMGQESAMQYISPEIQRASVRLEIMTNPTYDANGGAVSSGEKGMGIILDETGDSITIVTVHHVAFPGQDWQRLTISNVFALYRPITINPNIGAPKGPVPTEEDWYVTDVTSLDDEIATIVIHKPKSAPSLLNGTNPTISTEPVCVGNKFVMLLAPPATYENPVAQMMDIIGMSPDDNGILQPTGNKPATHGASGGVVITPDGRVAALVYAAPPGNPGETIVIPIFPYLASIKP